MIGVWFIQVPWFERLNLSNLYLSLFPSSLLITISSAVTLSAIPLFLATTTAPESFAALYSTPVPMIGASLLIRGTAWRCMLAPIRALLASSFSRNGIIAVAIDTTCLGDISMKSTLSVGTSSTVPFTVLHTTFEFMKLPSSFNGSFACTLMNKSSSSAVR